MNTELLDPRPSRGHALQDSTPLRVAFVTLGCKVNQSDTQKAIADFRAAGFRIVPPSSPADVYVVNTCSVTHVADSKSRQWLRRGARLNPNALVVAAGCYAESGRETLQQMVEVGLVVGYRDKENLVDLVLEQVQDSKFRAHRRRNLEPETLSSELRSPAWAGGETEPGIEFRSRVRAMVKIEDGCNDFCTFCIIPFTRGMPRSTPTGRIIEAIKDRLAEGYNEIVLTGVHMGKYGQDHAQRKRAQLDTGEARDLPGVLKAILELTHVPRLRITSLEPTDAVMVLPLMADPVYRGRLAPHLHLPLQSGCDSTLQRMRRDYSTAEYASVVAQCREAVPELSITTDLITGFPGETEEEWAQTRDFVQKMQFAKVHVFPFSRRPGTPAYEMEGQVEDRVRHSRTLEMMRLSTELESVYACAHLGQTLSVLWENESGRVWSGLTSNYLRVHTHTTDNMMNRITPATVTSYDAQGLWADPLSGNPL